MERKTAAQRKLEAQLKKYRKMYGKVTTAQAKEDLQKLIDFTKQRLGRLSD